MNELLIRYSIIYIFLGLFLIARPWLSRKNVLFGVVFGDTKIWKQTSIRNIVYRFVFVCTAVTVILAAIFLFIFNKVQMNEADLKNLCASFIIALILVNLIPYIIANRSMKRLKETYQSGSLVKGKITVEIGNSPIYRPISANWFLLLLLPIAVTALLTAIYYPEIPEKVATHYNSGGAADAWGAKSLSLVAGPILGQLVFAAVMFLIGFFTRSAPASVKGSPGAAPNYPFFRRFVSLLIIGLALIVETKYMITELVYAGVIQNERSGMLVISALIIILLFVLLLAFYQMVRRQEPTGAVLDDDSRWVLGKIYFNPSDPSLFVEKRNGIGRTINFGRPTAWIILAAIILIIIFKDLINR